MRHLVRLHWVLGLSLLVLTGASCARRDTLISDTELRARFQMHRAELDSLASMVVADTGLLSVSRGRSGLGIYVRDSLSGDRLLAREEIQASGRSEYGRLLALVGFNSLSHFAGPSVWFSAQADDHSGKGLVFTPEALAPLLESLDGLGGDGAPTTAYVQLAKGWYLFIVPKAE